MNWRLLLSCAATTLLLLTGSPTPAASDLALDTRISVPIDLSGDGELLLLFRPGLRGFELVNTRTGQRDLISATPCTGYFASISPDKRFVCYKDFVESAGRRLQVPMLYDIAQKKSRPLCKPAAAAGNPVVSSRGQIAYTLGRQLVLLNSNFSDALALDLGVPVNVLAFSPDGQRLAFSDPDERIAWIELATGKRGSPPAGVRGYHPRFSPKGDSLLARTRGDEIIACNLADGRVRNFGHAQTAAWLDEDTVALVRNEITNFTVARTDVAAVKLSNGSTTLLLTQPGDAAFALQSTVMALAAEDGLTIADPSSGQRRKSAAELLSASSSEPETVGAMSLAKLEVPTLNNVVTNSTTNGTTVQLVNVPYINQVYDTADSFPGGGSCCNATATLMAIQHYRRLPPHPITCTDGGSHTSDYGWYVSSIYSYNGYVFDAPSSAAWGTDLEGYYGGFGYFLQDYSSTSLGRSTRLKEYIQYHGLASATDDSPTIEKVRSEINSNSPVVVLNGLTSSGHYITCIGYIEGQHSLIFNDPYGNKAISYPGKQGAGAIYDWPGYNNGYPNLNSVGRYIYARGTTSANTNFGSYWDRNGSVAGAGATPAGTWDSISTNWSSSVNGDVVTGPWAAQSAWFSAGSDATNAYTISVSGTQVVNHLYVRQGAVTFTGGSLYFRGTGSYYSNYVAAGGTATFNTPFVGPSSPDKWGPGTAIYNGVNTSGGFFSLNEGTLALGNDAALSSIRLVIGDPGGVNLVTLRSANATAHAFSNKLTLNATNFIIGAGGNLTFSGPIDVGPSSSVATVIAVSNSVTTLSGVLTNTSGLGKTGPGTLVLAGSDTNTYGSAATNGFTTVSGGTLKLSKTAGVTAVSNGRLIVNAGGTLLLGADDQIGDAVPLTLGGGAFQSAGFDEQAGALTLAANSTIDLGAGAGALSFAASSGVSWTGGAVLTISNWTGSVAGGGGNRIMFGSDGAGLTSGQISQIRFVDPLGFPAGTYPATQLSSGEVVPLAVAPTITNVIRLANGQLQFTVTGVPGFEYAILASTDLANWTKLWSSTAPFTWADADTNSPQRFYRAQYPP